jgi:ribosomal protein S18 acetylase RimI-like enzyme
MATHILDNPMYNALLTEHAPVAIGGGRARRFPAQIAPFGGLELSGEADLLSLFQVGERAVFVGSFPLDQAGWKVAKEFEVIQMTLEDARSVSELSDIQLLIESDVSAMLKLTSLVYPSYFRPETAKLGEYCGIYAGEELIAMSGIRMKLPGYEEISAICTHLDHRGRGLGSMVTKFMTQRIIQRGNTPFLHTESDNPAQAMYQKLGFKPRAHLPVKVMERTTLPN